MLLALIDLHGVAQGAAGARDDGDLLHGSRMTLAGGHHGVAYLVIGNDALLVGRDDGTLLLFAGDDGLDALLKVGRLDLRLAQTHGTQGSLVDDVGDVGTAGAGCGTSYHIHVDFAMLHLLQVDGQNGLASLEVGQLHDDATVESAGAEQRLVERLGPVGGSEDDQALVAIEAVHLGEQLVERLLALVVAHARVAALADGVNLVDEDDARGLLAGLLEEVAHLGGPHAHKHLHKLGTRDGEEGHLGLAGHGTSYQGLACAWRPYEQGSLGQLGTQFGVFGGIVEEIDNLLQRGLGLVLSGHVGERRLDVILGIELGTALPERQEVAPGAALHHASRSTLPYPVEQEARQYPPQEEIEQRGIFLGLCRFRLGSWLAAADRPDRGR